jgi:hypothetical protein
MKTRHTPGPWKWNEHYNGLEGVGQSVLKYADYEGMWLSFNNYEADAQLIAAAPELLAALERVVNEAADDDMDDWFANARAAIAKATNNSGQS